MKLTDKNILIVSPEPWSHIFVSKHHYATHLAKRGNQVYFLNPPTGAFKLQQTDYQGVETIDYKGFLPGLKYFPSFIIRWLTRRVFDQLEQLAGVKFDIVWSFDNSVFYQFDALPKRVYKISHIVDLAQNFELAKAAISADVCFGVTASIVDALKKYNENSFRINHGLSFQSTNIQISSKVPGNNQYKSFYLGNIAMRHLDWKVFYEAAKSNLNVDFIFIGPGEKNETNNYFNFELEIRTLSNVYFISKIPSEHVQSYLEEADMLLLAYQEYFHKDASNSHKILEYLYSGKPIIASYTADYDGSNLLYMSKRNEDWPKVFDQVLENLDEYSSKELADKRKKYALDHTYDKQIDRIEKILASLPS